MQNVPCEPYMLSIIMLSVIMLNVVMLNVVMLNVVMLSVVAAVKRLNDKANDVTIYVYIDTHTRLAMNLPYMGHPRKVCMIGFCRNEHLI